MPLNLPLEIKLSTAAQYAFTSMLFLFFFVPGLLLYFKLGAPRPAGEDPNTIVYTGIVFCVVALVSAPVFFVIVHKGKPATIKRDGLIFPMYSFDYKVAWSKVSNARVRSVRGIKFICLDVEDTVPTTFISRMNKAFGYGDINISTFASGLAHREVSALIDSLIAAAKC